MTTPEPTRAALEVAVVKSRLEAMSLLPRSSRSDGTVCTCFLCAERSTKQAAILRAYGAACQALGEHIGREAEAKQVEAADSLALTVWEQIEDLAGVHAVECAVLDGDYCNCQVLRAVEFLTAEFESYERARPEPFEVTEASAP